MDESHVETLAIDPSFIQASSFTSETTLDATYTTEVPSEESRTSLAKDSNTTAQLQTPEASSGESAENRAPFKRSSKHSKGSRRKRRNTDDSDDGLSHQSELDGSRSSGLSRHFENHVLRQKPDSQSSRDDLQQTSLDLPVKKLALQQEESLILELPNPSRVTAFRR